LEENLYPNTDELISKPFRDHELYTYKVSEIISKNEFGLKKMFGLFIHGQKRYLTNRDAFELINTKGELKF
jgi:hypothetical protein